MATYEIVMWIVNGLLFLLIIRLALDMREEDKKERR